MMAEEEKQRVEEGQAAAHDVSAGAFLLLGIEIQGLQCAFHLLQGCSPLISDILDRQALHLKVSGLRKQTLLQTTSLVERRTILVKRIQHFREIQWYYMPSFDHRNYSTSEPSTADSTTASTKLTEVFWQHTSSSENGVRSCWARIRFITAAWRAATPLGRPVEPEV